MYCIDQNTFEPESAEGQSILAAAWEAKKRVDCLCKTPPPQMYIARVGGSYIVKRMPDSGPSHAITCESYTAPEFLSGMGQLERAVRTDDDKTTKTLAVNFSLSIRGAGAAPTPGEASEPRDIISKPKQMSLSAVLQYLWLEAGLVLWHPGFYKKRWWGLIRQRLLEAAEGTRVKRSDLSDRLFIPEAFKADHKDAIFARNRKRLFEVAAPSSGSQKLGLVVAEYKSHEETTRGAKFTFKHAPGIGFFADQDFARRFDKLATRYLDMAAMIEGAKVIVIGTFAMRKAGYPEIKDMGLMLVNSDWIPFDDADEAALLDSLTTNRRAFIKSLRFDLPKDNVIPHSILTDVRRDEPVALYLQRLGQEDMICAAVKESPHAYVLIDPLSAQTTQLPERLGQPTSL